MPRPPVPHRPPARTADPGMCCVMVGVLACHMARSPGQSSPHLQPARPLRWPPPWALARTPRPGPAPACLLKALGRLRARNSLLHVHHRKVAGHGAGDGGCTPASAQRRPGP